LIPITTLCGPKTTAQIKKEIPIVQFNDEKTHSTKTRIPTPSGPARQPHTTHDTTAPDEPAGCVCKRADPTKRMSLMHDIPSVESLEIINEKELDLISNDFHDRILTHGQDRIDYDEDTAMDRRLTLSLTDPMHQLISNIIWRGIERFPSPGKITGLYIAYQRQYIPHNLHVDVGDDPNVDNRGGFSLIIPISDDPGFQTLIWNLECNVKSTFLRWVSSIDWKNDAVLSDVGKDYNVDHCRGPDGSLAMNYLEFLGAYQYRRGTVGKFPRNHPHCSSNWKASGRHSHKDFVIIHSLVIDNV
jgi:hypothetical protein